MLKYSDRYAAGLQWQERALSIAITQSSLRGHQQNIGHGGEETKLLVLKNPPFLKETDPVDPTLFILPLPPVIPPLPDLLDCFEE